MKDEIKEALEKFNKEVEKAELTRNPYSSEDKKFKHILVSLSEEHFNIFKDILDYITNLQQERNDYKDGFNLMSKFRNKALARERDYKSRIDKANNILKDTSVDMPETLLIETIDYARHILNGDDK